MLPIHEIAPQIIAHLNRVNRLVLTAPTGSGKTTQVPQILLHAGLVSGRLLVLQPRRLATRLVAQRVARELDTVVGGLVGYQTRHDNRVSQATRLSFVTEGLFLRFFQADPQLTGIGVVVLDEFHERSLAADTALGLVRRLQESTRPDLRLIVMSATLDARRLADFLDCPMLAAHGRTYKVEIGYRPGAGDAPVWERAADALRALLERAPEGDVLIFMPGAYEIRRTIETAHRLLGRQAASLAFLPLHGALPAAQQDAAVSPGAQRKVIVATNVAETSITIPGVRHVIDAGLARVHRHDPRRGIDVLLIEPISEAAAQQRAGRAGRTAPGACVRLWSQAERRPAHELPEIRRLDLAEAVLQLKYLGIEQVLDFPWLEPPEAPAVNNALTLLAELGALDGAGQLTDLGRRMALLPMHPRLSRFLLEAAARRCLGRAMVWAALVGERDILFHPPPSRYTRVPDDPYPSDLVVREQALEEAWKMGFDPSACAAIGVQAQACGELERTIELFRKASRRAGLRASGQGRIEDLLKCLLVAFYDRVALRRDADTLNCAMGGQRRVELDGRSVARESGALIALEIREQEAGRNRVRTILSLASAIDVAWLKEVHPHRLEQRAEVVWNSADQAVEQFTAWAYDGLVYHRQPERRIDPPAAERLLVEKIQSGELRLDRWDEGVRQWLYRVRLLARLFPERDLLAYDEEDIGALLHEIVAGATRYSHLRQRDCLSCIRNALSYPERQFVDLQAPVQLMLPVGGRLKIEYYPDGPPRGRARIQELYGLTQSPRIAAGRQPVLLEILAPNFRPVQVTDDLANFWQITYPQVKKELERRYPKHEWR